VLRRFGRFRTEDESPRLEMAGFLDAVFILLIFFVVTTTFLRHGAVDVERPEVGAAATLPDDALEVVLTADHRLLIDGEPTRGDGEAALRRKLARGDARRVVIHADRRADSGALIRLVDRCRRAGAGTVQVATREAWR